MVAAAVGAAAVGGIATSAMGASAAGRAANAESSAANQAAALQESQYQQTRNDLLPYMQAGQTQLGDLSNYPGQTLAAVKGAYDTASANVPGPMSIDFLEQTPGYKFALDQGLKSVQASAAARGLGVSGAALKGAANFSTGLAQNTYQNQFDIANARFNDYNTLVGTGINAYNAPYNQALNTATLGANAAARSGTIGQQGAAAAGGNIVGAGNATAGGITGQQNAINSGINSLSSIPLNYMMMSNMLKSGGGTDTTTPMGATS